MLSVADGLIMEGLQKGYRTGRREGLSEGLQKGRQEGLEDGIKQSAMKLLLSGMSAEQVSAVLELDLEEVKALQVKTTVE